MSYVRSTPRKKVSAPIGKSLDTQETIQKPKIKLDKWDRLQELKRRREEIKQYGDSSDEKRNKKPREGDRLQDEKLLKKNSNVDKSKPIVSISPAEDFKPLKPSPLPKSLHKYVHLNSHLKGVDHGRLNAKGPLEHELDKAVENGDLVLATKISDQIAQKNYETIVSEAIERKEYNEAKEREEAFKAKKKKPKLRWGFETKQRWETKSNM
nr:9415_t:CDS:2 [Entrophospora candida]CAG8443903.1 13421_t:CDS:2 [Entrophospora candida]